MRFNLEELMVDRRINQTQLAQGLGVSKQAVSNWLAGRSLPNKDTLEELCLFLECGIEEIFKLEKTQTTTGKTFKDFSLGFAA